MNIRNKAAIVTGAGSGIGQAVAFELAQRGAKAVGLIDRSERVLEVARVSTARLAARVAEAWIGDVTDAGFRRKTFDLLCSQYGPPGVCIPAAGITRDQLGVRIDKSSGRAQIYPIEDFRLVCEVNLIAP